MTEPARERCAARTPGEPSFQCTLPAGHDREHQHHYTDEALGPRVMHFWTKPERTKP